MRWIGRQRISVVGAVTVAVAISAVGAARPAAALAANVQLDASFAAGERSFDIRNTADLHPIVHVRSGGQVVVSANSQRPSTTGFSDRDPAFVQTLSNGTPDEGFGTHGVKIVTLPTGANVLDFAIDANGAILGLALGTSRSQYVFRLTSTGTLDSGFGTSGVVTLPSDSNVFWQRITVQPDHRIIIAGDITVSPSESDTIVERLTSGGAFDAELSLLIGNGRSDSQDVSVAPNGAFVAIAADSSDDGTGHHAIGVMLLDGTSFDPVLAFGPHGNGTATVRPSQSVFATDIRVSNGGKVTVAGDTDASVRRVFVARMKSNGTPDTTFSGDGQLKLTTAPIGFAMSLDIDASGRLTLTASPSGNGVVAARVLSNGTMDSTFGNGGVSQFAQPIQLNAERATTAPDGSPVIVGATLGTNLDVGVIRLTPTGAPDRTFHPGGTALYDLSSDPGERNTGSALAVGANGHIYTAGFTTTDPPGDAFWVLGLLPNGERDLLYGGEGTGSADRTLLPDAAAHGIAMASGNRAVVVGCDHCGTAPDFAVVRYTSAGILDSTFSGDGKVTTSFGASVDATALAVAVQPNGRIVVVGRAGSSLAVARYTASGTLDHSFSGDGKLTTGFGGLSTDAVGVAIQSDGKIVVAGTNFNNVGEQFAVARYNTNGTLDHSFSGDGKVLTAFTEGSAEASSIAIRPDGGIIVAGHVSASSGEVALVRYRTNGTLDSTFSGDGRLAAALGSGDDAASGVAAAGNKIVIGGLNDSGTGEFLVARFTAGGALDTSFSGTGFETSAEPPGESIDDMGGMAIAPSGRIVVAGTGIFNGAFDVTVAQYVP